MNRTDLAGTVFGMLTVCGDSGQRLRGNVLWDCRCSCGKSILATRRQLMEGSVKNCGCTPEEPEFRGADLTGMQFGELTVLRRVESDSYGHPQWLCRCSCGKESVVLGNNLKKGRIRSCGCKQYTGFRGKDLTGMRFGRLTVIRPVSKKDAQTGVRWLCQCDCGCETETSAKQLMGGTKQSCGCLQREQRSDVQDHLHYENDTCLERLIRARNTTSENQAGFRGLFLTRRGSYRASITFRKKHYTLGYYGTFGEAVQARLEAEESLHAGYITASEKYRSRAEADPAWAADNQFFYNVVRTGGEFQVSTNGV